MTDNQELAHRLDNRALAPQNESRSDSFLAMLLEAARDPSIDAAKVETMANLAIKLQDRERETKFAQDFAAALMEMPYISKRGTIVIPAKDGKPAREQGKFALFEDLDKVVKPILARHNMVISFRLGSDGPMTTAIPILTHTNGFRDIGDALKVPPDTSGSKNNAQAIGSSSSYAKRYAMCAALNIVTIGEDRDGTSYPLADDPLTDRQERMLKEADASHVNGDYTEWYSRQTPKDRSWLVIRGVHERLGGGTALPSAGARPSQQPEQSQRQQHDTSTPEGWAADYCDRMNIAPDAATVDRIKASGKNGLAKLADMPDQRLFERCDSAEMDARERVKSGGML